MKHKITLYGTGFARSARCRWTLQELGLGLEFEDIDDGSMSYENSIRNQRSQRLLSMATDYFSLPQFVPICAILRLIRV